MDKLPSHRQLLASLIDSLSKDAHPSQEDSDNTSIIPQDCRRLLLTLHVLFPNLLLPALDLLDRRLIIRVRSSLAEAITGDQRPTENNVWDLYVVKSVASTLTRRHRENTASKSYAVRLSAWNCSCVSFVFDAFSPEKVASEEDDVGETQSWSFGGLSLDGRTGAAEHVPCCKHLLACLLAQRWNGLLGGYIDERIATREELAGIIAGL